MVTTTLNRFSPWGRHIANSGVVTGLLHAKGGINPLPAGILTMLALYSINLRIMGNRANVPLLGHDTVYSWFSANGITGWVLILVLFVIILIFKFLLDWFLGTDMGLGLQATGDNEEMVRSFGVSTDAMKIVGLAVSNGLVGLAGAFIAQKQGSADISMGIGLILVGLASVILGQALFHNRFVTSFADTAVGRIILEHETVKSLWQRRLSSSAPSFTVPLSKAHWPLDSTRTICA